MLHDAPAAWGWLDLVVLDDEDLAGICGYSMGKTSRCHLLPRHEFPEHELRNGRFVKSAAVWYRAQSDVPVTAHATAMRGRTLSMPTDVFRQWIPQGWVHPPESGFLCVLEDRSADPPRWTTWWVSPSQAAPANLIEFDACADPFAQLDGLWPRKDAAGAHVAVIGVGSIGSAAAESIVSYGIGLISLVDYDRLEPRNLVRHRCGAKDVGRFKVDALAERLRGMSGSHVVRPYRWNVVTDANRVRGLLRDNVDLALVCTDGVESRQACTHLTRWAGVHAVFACVLEGGAVGEIVRVPHRHGFGCLSCLRRTMREAGSLDPEPGIDLEYGTGTAHRPMTAVGGDLGLVGSWAAKAAVATLLEQAGHWNHKLIDDHVIVGLQPAADLLKPFDMRSVLEVTSDGLPPPDPRCPACAASSLHYPS